MTEFPSQRGELAPFQLSADHHWPQDVWHNASDGYSKRVISYAADWAWLMEQEITKNRTIAEMAEETSHLADYDGITGFMYGAAVAELAANWAYGEQLRRWHNSDYGQPDTDGVINPTIVTVRAES